MNALAAVLALSLHSAWIPPWDANALTSIQTNMGSLQESNPVWYSWNADGTIAKNWNAENPTWRAAMTGTRLMPTIQNVIAGSFDAAAVQTMLATADSRDAHASAIAQLAVTNAFDGIDVDYERIPATSRANFTAFVNSLAQKLHAAGKKLSVTVYPKTSDVNWNGAGAEEWAAIGAAADEVKIMAYDYHYSSSGPGDITPLHWLDQVTTYAESVIPAQKIIVGLPWYGYDWSPTSTRSVTYASAMTTAQSTNSAITHDADGEATFTYADHVVYFQDAAAYSKKIELLQQKHPGIGGIANWMAGVEDPAVWPVMKAAATAPRRGRVARH
jgi:spore germination protein YaaH